MSDGILRKLADALVVNRQLDAPEATSSRDTECLIHSEFSVTDLNVASILVWGKMGRLNLSPYPKVARWLDSCLARPAYGRVRDRTRHK